MSSEICSEILIIVVQPGGKDKKVPRDNLTRSFCLYHSPLFSLQHVVIMLIVFSRSISRLLCVIITPSTNDILLIFLRLRMTGPVGGPAQCLHSEHNTTPVTQLRHIFPMGTQTIELLPPPQYLTFNSIIINFCYLHHKPLEM